ncbi:MAG: M28 family peptidase [Hyphomonadaceae bacterium]|nr:M28 family peptidase [Hyphomonadaceae bacterium]
MALFAALMFAGLALTPDAVRANNAPDQFDARASRARLERILGDETPHPVDSAAQDVVRENLLREIEALGLVPEARDAFTCRPQPRGPLIDCARVRNIMFSVGPNEGPAILAAAHYDSVAAAPGASDDGIGLSVWLEIARSLSQESLTRRVIFLFTDGEEPGLLGAYAFANDDPLMASVESLVNLEARGSRGPAIFFESNQPNGDAVAAFGFAPRPIANSVTADVYALLSNSSDVTALTRPGLDVLNIALLDGLEDYHTPQDNIASQDLRSVQHMGDVALSVIRRLATERDRDDPTPVVYTDVASRVFLAMPVWVGQGLLALSALVAAFAFWRAAPEGRWSALAAPPLVVIGAGALAFGVGALLASLRPGSDLGFAYSEPMRAWCMALPLFVAVLALLLLRSNRDAAQTGAAAALWFALIGAALSVFLSGSSILFAIPATVFAIGALVSLVWKLGERVGAWLAALVVLAIWAPLLFLIELALGFEAPFAFSILAALLLLPGLGPIAQARGGGRWRELVCLAALGAVIPVWLAAVTPSMSVERPRSLNINYFLNTTEGDARVLAGSAERELPAGLADAFSPEFILPGDRAPTWAAPATPIPLAPPALEDITVTREGDHRVVRARLSMNGAYRAIIRLPAAAQPLRATANGAAADFAETGGERSDFLNFACQGRACDGAALEIVLGSEAADDWFIIGQFPGPTSPEAQALRQRRGATATPIQGGDGATTLSRFSIQ